MDGPEDLLAALDSEDWQEIRDGVEEAGEALRTANMPATLRPAVAQKFLRLSRHANWQVRKAVAHAALYLRHDLFHAIIANLIDDDNIWVSDVARRTLSRRSELSRAEVETPDPADADNRMLDELERRHGRKVRKLVLELAERRHHRFVKETYHEIIRILSPLDGCMLNLKHELSSRPGMEQTAERVTRGHQYVGLISQFLDNLREFTVGTPAETTRECLSSIIREAATLAQQGIDLPDAGFEFRLNLPESLFLAGHRSRLLQAFINIFTNAIEACEVMDRSGLVSISLERQADAYARIVIADNGCGMAHDAVRDCVDLFSSGKPSGMGFGLPIARKVIEQDHCGTLAIESTAGEGTAVTILLPVERLDAEVS